jgi:hypothetical protein
MRDCRNPSHPFVTVRTKEKVEDRGLNKEEWSRLTKKKVGGEKGTGDEYAVRASQSRNRKDVKGFELGLERGTPSSSSSFLLQISHSKHRSH